MKNMAFSMTIPQVRAGTKTVTRRIGWEDLKPGDQFCAVEKGMGLKPGEKVVRLAILRCVSNRKERLNRMTTDRAYGIAECVREGFPLMTPEQFVIFFCLGHKLKDGKRCTSESEVSRISFEYVRHLP